MHVPSDDSLSVDEADVSQEAILHSHLFARASRVAEAAEEGPVPTPKQRAARGGQAHRDLAHLFAKGGEALGNCGECVGIALKAAWSFSAFSEICAR